MGGMYQVFYRKFAQTYIPKLTAAIFDYLYNVPWKFKNTQGRSDKGQEVVNELDKLVKRHMGVPEKQKVRLFPAICLILL